MSTLRLEFNIFNKDITISQSWSPMRQGAVDNIYYHLHINSGAQEFSFRDQNSSYLHTKPKHTGQAPSEVRNYLYNRI